jgi:hypothetical protein
MPTVAADFRCCPRRFAICAAVIAAFTRLAVTTRVLALLSVHTRLPWVGRDRWGNASRRWAKQSSRMTRLPSGGTTGRLNFSRQEG